LRERRLHSVEPIRFVNQLESGTSSIVLMFRAGVQRPSRP
jgi:hypothetical protein